MCVCVCGGGVAPPVRVGMVISSLGRPCGVGECSRALVEAMARLGAEVRVIPDGPWAALPAARGAGLGLVHFQYEYNLMDAGALAAAIRELARAGIRSVVTVHSWSPEAEAANRVLAAAPCLFIATMPALRLAMLRWGIAPERVTVIPLGIPAHPPGPREEARARLGLGREPAVGFFGFFHRHKGIEKLALAARLARARHPGLRCFVFATAAPNEGSRAARAGLHGFLAAHGLEEVVAVVKEYVPEPEMVRRLHAMDVNVLPYEELAGVQASAAVRTVLAARRPTVVTDTAHFSDLGRAVCRIPDNGPDRIAEAVIRLLDEPVKARALAEEAARLAERLSWDRVARAHLDCYREIRRSAPDGLSGAASPA